jgi:hypothetical protein
VEEDVDGVVREDAVAEEVPFEGRQQFGNGRVVPGEALLRGADVDDRDEVFQREGAHEGIVDEDLHVVGDELTVEGRAVDGEGEDREAGEEQQGGADRPVACDGLGRVDRRAARLADRFDPRLEHHRTR